MMKASYGWFIVVLLCVSFADVYALVEVPAGRVFGVWSAQNNPYRVRDHIWVAEGSTLVIGAGVVVESAPGVEIRNLGRLIAVGTEETPIIFRAIPPENMEEPIQPWGGLHFLEGTIEESEMMEGTKVKYATIEHADNGIFLSQARPILENLRLLHNRIGIRGAFVSGDHIF